MLQEGSCGILFGEIIRRSGPSSKCYIVLMAWMLNWDGIRVSEYSAIEEKLIKNLPVLDDSTTM